MHQEKHAMILILIAAKTYRYPFTCPSMGLLGQGRRARSALEVLARVVLFLLFFFCVCVYVCLCVCVGGGSQEGVGGSVASLWCSWLVEALSRGSLEPGQ